MELSPSKTLILEDRRAIPRTNRAQRQFTKMWFLSDYLYLPKAITSIAYYVYLIIKRNLITIANLTIPILRFSDGWCKDATFNPQSRWLTSPPSFCETIRRPSLLTSRSPSLNVPLCVLAGTQTRTNTWQLFSGTRKRTHRKKARGSWSLQEFADGGLVGRQGELDRLPRSCHRKSGHGGGGGLSPELRGDAGKRRGVWRYKAGAAGVRRLWEGSGWHLQSNAFSTPFSCSVFFSEFVLSFPCSCIFLSVWNGQIIGWTLSGTCVIGQCHWKNLVHEKVWILVL